MSTAAERAELLARQPWAGPTRRYDIVTEPAIALVVTAALALGLAAAFGSPDESALPVKGWAAPPRTTCTPPRSGSSQAPAARRPAGRPTTRAARA